MQHLSLGVPDHMPGAALMPDLIANTQELPAAERVTSIYQLYTQAVGVAAYHSIGAGVSMMGHILPGESEKRKDFMT